MCASSIPLAIHSEKKEALRIYPNPFKEYLIVETQQEFDLGMSLQLTDITGRKVLEKNLIPGRFNQKVDLPFLSPGLYLCQIYLNGKGLNAFKLIRQ